MLTTFFLTATAAITGAFIEICTIYDFYIYNYPIRILTIFYICLQVVNSQLRFDVKMATSLVGRLSINFQFQSQMLGIQHQIELWFQRRQKQERERRRNSSAGLGRHGFGRIYRWQVSSAPWGSRQRMSEALSTSHRSLIFSPRDFWPDVATQSITRQFM